ncbi:hypothetical protein [Streptomyces sp. NPDC002685]|uniref:hypothetical protein n=1 Tax=Streptomyces sp. NPDC002685 TaxID=3154540 RepID=UPI0033202E71
MAPDTFRHRATVRALLGLPDDDVPHITFAGPLAPPLFRYLHTSLTPQAPLTAWQTPYAGHARIQQSAPQVDLPPPPPSSGGPVASRRVPQINSRPQKGTSQLTPGEPGTAPAVSTGPQRSPGPDRPTLPEPPGPSLAAFDSEREEARPSSPGMPRAAPAGELARSSAHPSDSAPPHVESWLLLDDSGPNTRDRNGGTRTSSTAPTPTPSRQMPSSDGVHPGSAPDSPPSAASSSWEVPHADTDSSRDIPRAPTGSGSETPRIATGDVAARPVPLPKSWQAPDPAVTVSPDEEHAPPPEPAALDFAEEVFVTAPPEEQRPPEPTQDPEPVRPEARRRTSNPVDAELPVAFWERRYLGRWRGRILR